MDKKNRTTKAGGSVRPTRGSASGPLLLQSSPVFGRLVTQLVNNREFVVVLGAGCSMPCGLPNFVTLKRKLLLQLSGRLVLRAEKSSLPDVDLQTFDAVWSNAHQADRREALLNVLPARADQLRGYYPLAELIKRGVFRMIVNYNIDTCLECALHSVRFDNFLLLVNGCYKPSFIQHSIEQPRLCTILKTHGDYRHGYYALSSREMLECYQELAPQLQQLTKKHLLIVGYSGNDYPFIRAIDCSTQGGEIWYINPTAPPDYLQQVMDIRASAGNFIPATFDDLFKSLEASLRRLSAEKIPPPKLKTAAKTASVKLRVLNKLGIHARSAALLVKTANKFSCDIFLEANGEKVNIKSAMALLLAAIGPGTEVTIIAEGHDCQQAIAELTIMFKRRFDEE